MPTPGTSSNVDFSQEESDQLRKILLKLGVGWGYFFVGFKFVFTKTEPFEVEMKSLYTNQSPKYVKLKKDSL